jgi:hypothetical protein
MQQVTRDELLELLGITSGTFDQLQHMGHVALAFGAPIPATPGRYLDCDVAGMAVNLGLMPSLGRENSTAIVSTCWPQWMAAVGRAEADPSRDYFMAVGGIGWDAENKRPQSFLVTNGTIDEIAQDFSRPDLVGFYTANISDIVRRLRARANAIGIDLSRPFFFPPNDPRLDEIMSTRIKREFEARMARLKNDKKKSAAVKAWRRRQDIAAAPRVKKERYQFGTNSVG